MLTIAISDNVLYLQCSTHCTCSTIGCHSNSWPL